MAILFAGGEDSDFSLGSTPVDTTAGRFRSGYARCGLGGVNSSTTAWQANSASFTASPLTSLWFSARIWNTGFTSTGNYFALIGVSLSSVSGKGIWIAAGNNSSKVQLQKVDGTVTVLATEAGVSLSTGSVRKLDVNIQNYGASSTITVYVDQNPIITYTGNSAVTGVSGFDQIGLQSPTGGGSQNYTFSEVIVSDQDTRALSLVTLAPNGAGTTQQWTGAYTDISEVTLSDATLASTNTVTQDQQATLSDLPAGSFAIKEIVVSARATTPAGSTATKVGLGLRSGASISPGTLQTANASFATYQQLMGPNDPATGSPWTAAAVNALQLNLRSG